MMEPLIFYGVSMMWELEDIVTHLVEKLNQKRKISNRKLRKERENERENEETEEANHLGDITLIHEEVEEEIDDERLVMEELNANVHTVRGRLFSEIKQLKKFIPQKRRFDGYTSKTDNERLHMLAKYYREKRRRNMENEVECGASTVGSIS